MKKRIISISICLMATWTLNAQNPVSWKYTVTKIAEKKYELHLTAVIQSNWHLYSQTQPAEAIAIPTSIAINKHPLIKLIGKAREIGKLEKHKDKSLGIEQWQYSGAVEFVQTMEIKANVKTNISGNVEYQACTDEKCLPPKKVEFNLRIE